MKFSMIENILIMRTEYGTTDSLSPDVELVVLLPSFKLDKNLSNYCEM